MFGRGIGFIRLFFLLSLRLLPALKRTQIQSRNVCV